jgi:uncharacterized protein (DUF305 family)
MTTFTVRLAAGLAAIATATALSSCSTATKTEERAGATASSSTPAAADAAHNSEDVMFAHMMIPHHEQALELSALAPDRSTDPALVKLAATIAAEQQPEIDTMKRLLTEWGAGMGDMGGMDHGGMAGGMMQGGMLGMVDPATMDKLRTLKGTDFDKLWLQSMIGHHEGAIAMAKPEVSKGQNAELVEMARNIITGQQAEIDQMKQMLTAMGG